MANVTVGIVLKGTADKAEKAVKRFAGAAKKAFKVVTVAAATVAAALVAITKKAADLADQLFIMSDRTGASTEFLSAMGYAARQSGSSMEAMEKAMRTVSKQALAGTRTFDKWGVTIKNSDGTLKNSEQIFASAADRISKMKNSTAQMAAAQDMFGRSGTELLPILRKGAAGIEEWRAKAEEAGVIVDSLGARLGNELNNQLGSTQDRFKALNFQIGRVFFPIAIALTEKLNGIISASIKWFKVNRELINSKLQDFLLWIANTGLPAVGVAADLVAKIWFGWKLLFQTLQLAAAAFVEGITAGFGEVAGGAAKVAEALGADGLAKDLRSMEAGFDEASKNAAKDVEAIGDEMAKTVGQIKTTENAIGRFSAAASAGLQQAAIDARILRDEMAGKGTTGNATTGGAGDIPIGGAGGGGGGGGGKSAFKVSASRAKALKTEAKAVQSLNSTYQQMAQQGLGAVMQGFKAMITGAQNAEQVLTGLLKQGIDMMLDFALQQITAQAASGGAGAFSSGVNSGIPYPWNLAAAASAAATAVAAILAFKGKMDTGGDMPIGSRGFVSIQGGETFTTDGQRRSQQARERDERPAQAEPRQLKVEINTLDMPTRARAERTLEDGLVRSLERMEERGAGLGRSRRPLAGVG